MKKWAAVGNELSKQAPTSRKKWAADGNRANGKEGDGDKEVDDRGSCCEWQEVWVLTPWLVVEALPPTEDWTVPY